MPLIQASLMNRAARVLFLSALGCFVVFHFVSFYVIPSRPSRAHDFDGWKIWGGLVANAFRDFSRVETTQMIGCSGFLTSVLLLVSSPFMVPVLRVSRLAWWVCVLISCAATLGFGSVVIHGVATFSSHIIFGPGFYCLSAAMLLNLFGFFFIRREIPPNPVVDPA